jgi:hypothetical protein
MKIFMIGIILIFISVSAYADELFTMSKLGYLRVLNADKATGVAWVADKNNEKSEVYVGDTVGIDGYIVIAIEDGYIEVKKDNTITTMKAIKKLNIQIDDSKVGPL